MHIEIQNCFSFWGTSSPRPPTGASPLDPTGGLLSPDPLHRTSPHILYQVYAPGRSHMNDIISQESSSELRCQQFIAGEQQTKVQMEPIFFHGLKGNHWFGTSQSQTPTQRHIADSVHSSGGHLIKRQNTRLPSTSRWQAHALS